MPIYFQFAYMYVYYFFGYYVNDIIISCEKIEPGYCYFQDKRSAYLHLQENASIYFQYQLLDYLNLQLVYL